MSCIVCGDRLHRDRGARAGRCGTCAKHYYTHKTERPEAAIIRQTERDIERELTSRWR